MRAYVLAFAYPAHHCRCRPQAVALAKALQQRGFDVRAIRSPTVPEGTAGVRVALIASLSEAMIADLFDAMEAELRRLA